MSDVILETSDVSKVFEIGGQAIRALSNLNLEISRGDFISIMGPSGSGKTTLLNILGCLDKPTKGRVIIDGDDVTAVPEHNLYKVRRSKVGFIFQTFNLMPHLTALENVELPSEVVRIPNVERRNKAEELLMKVGLSERMEHRPQALSAGERQRVAIARALINDPSIILADEPTGNLDGKTKIEIIRLLMRINQENGTTIILVTHDNKIASQTNRMLFLTSGRLRNKRRRGTFSKTQYVKCQVCKWRCNSASNFCPKCGGQLKGS